MTFLWHDYETFGINAAFDRPVQFAAIRTNEALEPLGKPQTWFSQPVSDSLPHPMACLVTGITPQRAQREGMRECEFARAIYDEMMVPGTCGAGYNSLRFDDQVSRHLFFRNFIDPYEREYRNGNSRWDLIDLVRMCFALRPDGINWPEREPGIASFKLEHLTAANDIEHAGAHDALVDVQATIALAALIKKAQPRLFEWALGMRDQKTVANLLDTTNPRPVLYTSSMIPAVRGCTTLVLPIATVPDRPKETIVIDLMGDPEPLLACTVDELRERLYTPTKDLPEGVERAPLSKVARNKVPMLAPEATLRGVDQERIGLDAERCHRHASRLLEHEGELRTKLMELFLPKISEPGPDVDDTLYSGDFFSDRDRKTMNQIRSSAAEMLGDFADKFEDPRLPEMLFRYRARNFPETLDANEFERWDRKRLAQFEDESVSGRLALEPFKKELIAARSDFGSDEKAVQILNQVELWVEALIQPQAIY